MEEWERREEEGLSVAQARRYLTETTEKTGREHMDNEAVLIELYRMANYHTASFGFPNDTVTVNAHFEQPLVAHPDTFIRDKTRLYRESWVNPVILELRRRLADLDAADKTLKVARKAREELDSDLDYLRGVRRDTEALEKHAAVLAEQIKDAELRLASLNDQLPTDSRGPRRVIAL